MAAANPIANLEPTSDAIVPVDTPAEVNYRLLQNGMARRKEGGGLIILEE